MWLFQQIRWDFILFHKKKSPFVVVAVAAVSVFVLKCTFLNEYYTCKWKELFFSTILFPPLPTPDLFLISVSPFSAMFLFLLSFPLSICFVFLHAFRMIHSHLVSS